MQIMASELFGHQKGSFTGAHTDHPGLFEASQGGLIFLDEIAELSLAAQAMLLRAISEREILPVGATRAKPVDVRIVAATNRDLRMLVEQGAFGADLFYRLNQLCVRTPPLRQRGRDWELIAQYHLDRLASTFRKRKSLAADAVEWLRDYSWPGNVRELTGCIETGFHMSVGAEITLRDIGEALEVTVQDEQLRRAAFASSPYSSAEYCERISGGEGTFWELIYEPFMARDLNRVQVREVIAHGLALADGSYKRMLRLFGMPDSDYLRFMDFLRHHRLKPPRDRVMAARLLDGGSPEAVLRSARAARQGSNGEHTQPEREAG
jgi:transcriptional regulator with GAF, ATPase, and Fis domain